MSVAPTPSLASCFCDFIYQMQMSSGTRGPLDVYNEVLLPNYAGEGRYYHNLQHISDCLRMYDEHVPERVGEIELAIYFHDLVYDPKVHDNEARSVQQLKSVALQLALPESLVAGASEAIMATCHTGIPEGYISKTVVDVDLSILGRSSSEFDVYEGLVRKEYSFVSEDAWRAGRTHVLQNFLDREWIYSTPSFRKVFEGQARANIKRSIHTLLTQ